MSKHKHIIVLNGRHYNSKTGEPLPHAGPSAHGHGPMPKPEASHHTPAPAPTPAAAQPKAARQHAASHITPHKPKAARTLMRQTVKKPDVSVKRRIRVQGHLDTQIKPPVIEVSVREAARPARRGTRHGHIKQIAHFSPSLFTTVSHATIIAAQPAPAPAHKAEPQPTMKPAFAAPFKKPRTTAELLDYAVRYAYSAPELKEPTRRKHARKHRRAHAMAH